MEESNPMNKNDEKFYKNIKPERQEVVSAALPLLEQVFKLHGFSIAEAHSICIFFAAQLFLTSHSEKSLFLAFAREAFDRVKEQIENRNERDERNN